MNILKNILIGVVVLVGALLLVIQTRPAEFHIERSLAIDAAPADVFPFIQDFHKWSTFSPWDKLDANMKREYSGASSGPGAVYAWSGNDKVGTGRMTIVDVIVPEQVKIQLDFIAPWEAHNTATFSLRSAPNGSVVTWMMDGENDFLGKAAGLFMDMDKLVGKDFEDGLQNLKRAAEALVKARPSSNAAAQAAAAQTVATTPPSAEPAAASSAVATSRAAASPSVMNVSGSASP
ncbi:MAG TPA: SRPBCC family protein [Polyangiaceae bacterium]|nr:SRPBCC family protein [Polyangiaceae bacterium]